VNGNYISTKTAMDIHPTHLNVSTKLDVHIPTGCDKRTALSLSQLTVAMTYTPIVDLKDASLSIECTDIRPHLLPLNNELEALLCKIYNDEGYDTSSVKTPRKEVTLVSMRNDLFDVVKNAVKTTVEEGYREDDYDLFDGVGAEKDAFMSPLDRLTSIPKYGINPLDRLTNLRPDKPEVRSSQSSVHEEVTLQDALRTVANIAGGVVKNAVEQIVEDGKIEAGDSFFHGKEGDTDEDVVVVAAAAEEGREKKEVVLEPEHRSNPLDVLADGGGDDVNFGTALKSVGMGFWGGFTKIVQDITAAADDLEIKEKEEVVREEVVREEVVMEEVAVEVRSDDGEVKEAREVQVTQAETTAGKAVESATAAGETAEAAITPLKTRTRPSRNR
jgi:hypothetical protein